KLAHFNIVPPSRRNSIPSGPVLGWPGAVHHQVGAETANKRAHLRDALIGAPVTFDVDRCFGAELAREFEPRPFRSADADHAPGAHFLRGRHRENPDRTRALNDDGVAPFEPANTRRAIKGADA